MRCAVADDAADRGSEESLVLRRLSIFPFLIRHFSFFICHRNTAELEHSSLADLQVGKGGLPPLKIHSHSSLK